MADTENAQLEIIHVYSYIAWYNFHSRHPMISVVSCSISALRSTLIIRQTKLISVYNKWATKKKKQQATNSKRCLWAKCYAWYTTFSLLCVLDEIDSVPADKKKTVKLLMRQSNEAEKPTTMNTVILFRSPTNNISTAHEMKYCTNSNANERRIKMSGEKKIIFDALFLSCVGSGMLFFIFGVEWKQINDNDRPVDKKQQTKNEWRGMKPARCVVEKY